MNINRMNRQERKDQYGYQLSKLHTESFADINMIKDKFLSFELDNREFDNTRIFGEVAVHIDARVCFFISVFTALIHCVMNLVLGLLSAFVAPFSESGRRFCVAHFERAGHDFVSVIIGAIGTWNPYTAFEVFERYSKVCEEVIEEELRANEN